MFGSELKINKQAFRNLYLPMRWIREKCRLETEASKLSQR